MLLGERNKAQMPGNGQSRTGPLEGTALHKRGTSAEEWEAAKSGQRGPDP